MGRLISGVLLLSILIGGVYVAGIVFGWYGDLEEAGTPTIAETPADLLLSRSQNQQDTSNAQNAKQILFGDLHVHTTFSSDAFRMSLPMVQGDGAHPPADACDFARLCSSLDFWALTDHAESLTPGNWSKSIESVQQCNAIAGDPSNPDLVTFMGFEWTNAGATPDEHYGHKNIIFRDTGTEQLPTRPIGSAYRAVFGSIPLKLRVAPPLRDFSNRHRYYDFSRLISAIGDVPPCSDDVPSNQLPTDCAETAVTPKVLFRKLDEWGFDSIVIPHGTTWGIYSPAGTSLDKQLAGGFHDPNRQTLIEVFSGHGNSEEYRPWSAVEMKPTGEVICPQPTQDYLPSCWRAGEIIYERCTKNGLDEPECKARAAVARQLYVDKGISGYFSVPGNTLEDWLDSGQCSDCFLPSFNYRPKGSAQYGLAITNFDNPSEPKRFRYGFVASSDNHSARPGTGYKEYARDPMVDWWGYRDRQSREFFSTDRGNPEPNSKDFDRTKIDMFNILELERQSSFFYTGGLVAAHSSGRDRNAVWSALKNKEVYGTSGKRMLLWFDLVTPDGLVPMGGEVATNKRPKFRVKALGSFKQKSGCPVQSVNAVDPNRLEQLCRGECYNPSDQREIITRIEVIRIRPQTSDGEAVDKLIEDPWQTFVCPADDAGCVAYFEDPEFESGMRDSVYYARAVQEPKLTINAKGLACEYDDQGQCLEVNACYGDDRTDPNDDCLGESEARAWSSPIFVDYANSMN